jgi:glucose uptake protein
MILPTTNAAAVMLLVLSAICWGSWANMQKRAGGRWRFELFYYDFSAGAMLCGIIAAFTVGSFDPKELTVQDNILITGYRNMVYAAGAGMVFNLGNMLLAGVLSVSGMTIAFPAGISVALVTAAVINYAFSPQVDATFLFTGIGLVLAAIVLICAAYTSQIEARRLAANRAAEADSNAPPRRRLPRAGRGIVLSAVGGIVMGGFYPLLAYGAWVEPAISPYSTALLFGTGIFLSTLLYNPFLMNSRCRAGPWSSRRTSTADAVNTCWGFSGSNLDGRGCLELRGLEFDWRSAIRCDGSIYDR